MNLRPILIAALFLGAWLSILLPGQAQADNADTRMPSYKECQKLASPKTDAAERASLTQRFKANNFYCALLGNPFTVTNVFTSGQGSAQLRLLMSADNHYRIEGKALLDILLPDHKTLSPLHIVMMAGQAFSLIGALFNSNFDPAEIGHAGARVNALAAGAGGNARILLEQIETLRLAAHLEESDVSVPFWLPRLASIHYDAQQQGAMAQNHLPGPAWMQKASGAVQHILGTLSGSAAE